MEFFLTQALPVIAHVLLVLALVVGTLGSMLPVVPGPLIIVGGTLVHGLLTGWQPLGLWTQLGLVGLLGVSQVAQIGLSSVGAKRYGASKFGMAGAVVGLVAGLVLLSPLVTPLLAPFVGAFLGATGLELLATQQGWVQPPALPRPKPEGETDVEEVERVAREALEPPLREAPTTYAARAGFGATLGAVMGVMAQFGVACAMSALVVFRFAWVWWIST